MYKQKLIDLLKSDEQTKTAMEKLEFGCLIEYKGKQEKILFCDNYRYTTSTFFANADKEYINQYCKIIGLPLQERFIRMYCKNKHYECTFNLESIYISCCFSKIDGIYDDKSFLIGLDNTKDFDNQEEEVYQKIYEALLELNK